VCNPPEVSQLLQVYHADLVAAVIAARLEAGGSALVSLAVRRQASQAMNMFLIPSQTL